MSQRIYCLKPQAIEAVFALHFFNDFFNDFFNNYELTKFCSNNFNNYAKIMFRNFAQSIFNNYEAHNFLRSVSV